jgi:hypothetical protein
VSVRAFRTITLSLIANTPDQSTQLNSTADLRLALLHLLPLAGHLYTDSDHIWHMEALAWLASADPGLLVATAFRRVDLSDQTFVAEGRGWWEELPEFRVANVWS